MRQIDPDLDAALRGLLTTPQVVARLLQLSPRTVCRMLDDRRLEGVKLGTVYRFHTEPLRAMLGLSDAASTQQAV